MEAEVILVDENDNAIGAMEKMRVHHEGILHRAFSVFVFNSKSELLLHRRATEKYHSGGLWTNTCCSHPMPGEDVVDAAKRRLMEEMGLTCELKKNFDFIYRADVGHNLIEHEFDHVFIGHSDEIPKPDAKEVSDWKWMDVKSIVTSLIEHPELYTTWFRIAWPMIIDEFNKKGELTQ